MTLLKTKDQYSELINAIFRLDGIRYAMILDDFGERIMGGMKPLVASLTPEEVEKNLELQATLILKMAENFAKHTGKLLYTEIHWERVAAMFFRLSEEETLCVSAEVNAGAQTQKLREILEDWKSGSDD
jgi:hypothetical protein